MAINSLKSLPPIGRAFFSKWLEKINEIINGVNDVGTTVNEELDPEVEGSLANTVAGIEEQLDPETEGTLANTVDGVVDEIGDDETANTILGRITALENSSGSSEWTVMSSSEKVQFFGVNSPDIAIKNETTKLMIVAKTGLIPANTESTYNVTICKLKTEHIAEALCVQMTTCGISGHTVYPTFSSDGTIWCQINNLGTVTVDTAWAAQAIIPYK